MKFALDNASLSLEMAIQHEATRYVADKDACCTRKATNCVERVIVVIQKMTSA
jgi:hypothetical protein